jgi:hypothetical protein
MGALTGRFSRWLGAGLSSYLNRPSHACHPAAPTRADQLMACIRPGDVLLVEGMTRVSTAIKFLTQSTWSHAAIYVGDVAGGMDTGGAPRCFVEADIEEDVRAVGVSTYQGHHCRVCRPVGLSDAEIENVVRYVVDRIGYRYDLKNVVDLARYLLPTPPVPVRWRRRMLALGSGDPTRAICSTLIAQAFQSVRYPILPIIESVPTNDPQCPGCVEEILRVRHHSLFVPRDFDVSPYFEIVKPELSAGFDHRRLGWEVRRALSREGANATAPVLSMTRAEQ